MIANLLKKEETNIAEVVFLFCTSVIASDNSILALVRGCSLRKRPHNLRFRLTASPRCARLAADEGGCWAD